MITFRTISLQRGTKILFTQLNLTLHARQKVGFIGANGCGKSSLFALLRRELHPDSGDIDYPPNLTIAHVAQETPAVTCSALDYVLDGDAELRSLERELHTAQQAEDGMLSGELYARYDAIGGYTAPARAAQLLHGLGFTAGSEHNVVNTFSGGWRMRLNLAQALMCRSDVLLLDEPTNHLDLDAVLWLENWLKHYQGTLLLISHDRDFLDNTVEAIAHIAQQQLTVYTGNYAAFEKQRAEQLAQQQAAYQKQQREMAHLQRFVDRFRAKASKAKQAQSRVKALEKMTLISAAQIDSPFHFDFPSAEGAPAILLDLKAVTLGYGTKVILDKVNLQLRRGQRLGLLGPNGAGKSTLIKLLAGDLTVKQGDFLQGEELKVGYFAQHQLEALDPEASALLHLQRLDPEASEQALRNFLGGFNFHGDQALDPIAPFSGGEKARLALALLVWQKPNLLLLDEPTNHLDLQMRHALSVALQAYEGALIIVSHDRHMLRTTTDELWLVANQRVKPFEGDLDDYRQWLLTHRANEKRDNAVAAAESSTTTKQIDRETRKQLETRRKPLQNQLKKLEQQLEKLTQAVNTVEAHLAQPEVYGDRVKMQQCVQEQTQLRGELEAVEEKWLTITEELEELSALLQGRAA